MRLRLVVRLPATDILNSGFTAVTTSHFRRLMPQGAARSRAGVLAFVDDDLAVGDDVPDAIAVLKRLLGGRAVDDAPLVENRNVGKNPSHRNLRSRRPIFAAWSEVLFRTA